jgi:hypothetical protein
MTRAWLILAAALAAGPARAESCDFEHRCYADPPPQIYHDLQGNVIPPPAPQYPRKTAPPVHVAPAAADQHVCHLVTIRQAPMLPAKIVEVCTLSAEEEQAIREGMQP